MKKEILILSTFFILSLLIVWFSFQIPVNTEINGMIHLYPMFPIHTLSG